MRGSGAISEHRVPMRGGWPGDRCLPRLAGPQPAGSAFIKCFHSGEEQLLKAMR